MKIIMLIFATIIAIIFPVIALAEDFINNGDGTVTDNSTGLIWQQGEGGSKAWEDAISYCEGLTLAGHSDWWLPNIKELESITDDNLAHPAIDTNFFPNAHDSRYWSSTSVAGSPVFAWFVDLSSGIVQYSTGKLQTGYVRCVRGGQ